MVRNPHIASARVSEVAGDVEAALTHWQHAAQAQPGDWELWQHVAATAVRAGRRRMARQSTIGDDEAARAVVAVAQQGLGAVARVHDVRGEDAELDPELLVFITELSLLAGDVDAALQAVTALTALPDTAVSAASCARATSALWRSVAEGRLTNGMTAESAQVRRCACVRSLL
jgi:hypothetical protein